jgi:hypothetical protein
VRVVSGLLLTGMLSCVTGVASAAPVAPANEKESRCVVPGGKSLIPEVEPNDACAAAMAVQCGDVVDPASISSGTDVDWYKVALTAGQIVIVATDIGAGGCTAVGDTYVELYYDCGTTRVAYDDDGGPGAYSLMTYIVPSGYAGEYEIKVRGYNSSYSGCYRLTVTCEAAWAPANDACWGAIPIPRCTSGRLTGNNSLALNEYDSTSSGCTGYPAYGKDVVYTLDLQAGDVVDLSYTQTNDDASLYVITDCADVAGSCVIGADNTYSGQAEVIHWVCPAVGLYYLILDSWAGSPGSPTGGAWTLDFAVACFQPAASCCDPATETCTMTTEMECLAPKTWHSDWTTCEPNPCSTSGVRAVTARAGEGILGLVPNPFTASTVLWYRLPKPDHVRLGIFDAAGRRVRSFELGEMGTGIHDCQWDGCESGGNPVAPGVYYARLSAGKQIWMRAGIRIK